MAITNQLHPGGTLGEVSIGDWRAANLLKPSASKPVFATIEQTLVTRRLGALSAADQSALRAAIASDRLGLRWMSGVRNFCLHLCKALHHLGHNRFDQI